MNPYLRLLRDNRGRVPSASSLSVRAEAGAQEAHMYVYDAIVDADWEAEWFGGVSKQAFIAALSQINAPQIRLHLDSPGGSVFASRSMAQALRDHGARVVAQVDGLAASAASVLAMAADEVQMAEGSMMMIHKAWTVAAGDADDLLDTAALLDKIDGTIAATYAKRTGMTEAEAMDLMAAETWLTAAEAISAKFADGMTNAVQAEPLKQNRIDWNLAAFRNAPPPAAAPSPAPSASVPAAAPPDSDGLNAIRARQSQRTRVAELALNQLV